MKIDIPENETCSAVVVILPGTEIHAVKGDLLLLNDGVQWAVKSIKYLGNCEWETIICGVSIIYKGAVIQRGIRAGGYDLAWFNITKNVQVEVIGGEMYLPTEEEPLSGFKGSIESFPEATFFYRSENYCGGE